MEGLIFGILWCTIVSRVTRPVLCWSAIGANSEVALQSETMEMHGHSAQLFQVSLPQPN